MAHSFLRPPILGITPVPAVVLARFPSFYRPADPFLAVRFAGIRRGTSRVSGRGGRGSFRSRLSGRAGGCPACPATGRGVLPAGPRHPLVGPALWQRRILALFGPVGAVCRADPGAAVGCRGGFAGYRALEGVRARRTVAPGGAGGGRRGGPGRRWEAAYFPAAAAALCERSRPFWFFFFFFPLFHRQLDHVVHVFEIRFDLLVFLHFRLRRHGLMSSRLPGILPCLIMSSASQI